MKSKKLLIALALMLLVFVPVSSQAATVQIDGTGTNATGILDLEVDGLFYDVTFLRATPNFVYGPDPNWNFDFEGTVAAEQALNAVNDALNTIPAVVTVGPVISPDWYIGYGLSASLTKIDAKEGQYFSGPPLNLDDWEPGEDLVKLSFDSITTIADFTVVNP
jgi:hypothetical protein